MSRFFSSLLVLIFISSLILASENYKQVKVFVDTDQIESIAKLGISFEGAYRSKDGGIILFVSDSEYQRLQNANFYSEVIIDNWKQYYSEREKITEAEKISQLDRTAAKFGIENYKFGSMGGFYTLEEIYSKIQELLDKYPNLVGGEEVIGQSVEGKNIYAFKVSVNPDVDEDEPEILYTALHHAREPEGMMQMFYFIQYLLDNYTIDDEVKYLLNNRELYFIPVVNPDGYFYNETIDPDGGGGWRKNRSLNEDSSYGVDLNRNYGPEEYWDAPNYGSSTLPYSTVYRGPVPFSEPETQAVKNFLNSHDIKACLNYHTYSNLLIFPYGALEEETADSNTFREFAVDMTVKNNYSVGTDMQTVNYSTRGNSDDYMYDGEPGRNKNFAMTPEVGNFMDGFWPQQNRIIPLAEENLLPNLYYANIVGGYPSVIVMVIDNKDEYPGKDISPGESFNLTPVIKNKGLEDSGDFEVKITSLSNGALVTTDNALIVENILARSTLTLDTYFLIEVDESVTNATDLFFEFDILQNGLLRRSDTLKVKVGRAIVLFEDTADSLEVYWDSKGVNQRWQKTKRYAYSGKYSYTDSKGSNYMSSQNTKLTMLNEISLTNLSSVYLYFQTRYHIESDWDGGFVEVSADSGASWDVVGGDLAKPAESFFRSNNVATGEPIYSGALFDWKQEEIDLVNYLGKNILIRFIFYSDGATEIDGWYLDDIKIVTYDSPTGIKGNVKNYNFSLEQNYPNPFNPTTKIKFTIPSVWQKGSSLYNTKLLVYDILGREVQTLIDSDLPAGNYEVDFNAKNGFSSWIYFYRLQSCSFSETRKMLLLK